MMSRRDRNRNRQQASLPDDVEIARQQKEMAAAQYKAYQDKQQLQGGVRRGCFIVVGIIIVAAIIGSMGSKNNTSGGASSSGGSNYSAPAAPTTHSLTYKITGTTSAASLTYQNAGGGTQQSDVSLPWQQSFTFDPGQFFYISAQNKNDAGDITCTVYIDAVPVKTSTSSGAYKIASCDGTVTYP